MSCNKNAVIISVDHVTKQYRLFSSPFKRLLFYLFHLKTGECFTALEDVSFSVRKGESFAIIGRNGSGKSTMLQILAGIIRPSSGHIFVNGKVAALLELGSGFDPECTGYENIYMNAAILGATKSEIEKRINQIIDFADIGDFIKQPVKTYSSGMYIRLAFSVAINVDADILLIDEALAVGDVFFRQKCYKKLNELKEQGKTIILVSHGMNEVEQFCDRALLLNKSKVLMCGDCREAVQKYYLLDHIDNLETQDSEFVTQIYDTKRKFVNKDYDFDIWKKRKGAEFNCNVLYDHEINNGKAVFVNVGIFDKNGNASNVFTQGDKAFFLFEVETLENIEVPLFGLVFYDQRNTIVFGKDNLQTRTSVPDKVSKKTVLCSLFSIKMDLAVGEYTFDAGFNSIDVNTYNNRHNYEQEEINSQMDRICTLSKVGTFSIQEKKIGDPMKISFHGCCDLASRIDVRI